MGNESERDDYSHLLDEDMRNAIERKGFDIELVEIPNKEEMYIELHRTTPMKLNWFPAVLVDRDATLADIADAFQKSADKFNINEEVIDNIGYYESLKPPQIPDIQNLLDDAKWQKAIFIEFGKELQKEFADNDKIAVKNDIEIERD